MNVVDFAHQILDMHERMFQLEIENERLRRIETQYNELLDSSLKASQQGAANWLKVLLKPGVLEAITKDEGNAA